MLQRSDLLARIKSNIAQTGYHVTVVTGGALPRFAYSIGCTTTLGAEFIFAGGEFYSKNQVKEIIAATISLATTQSAWPDLVVSLGSLGNFSLVKAVTSWSKLLLLGAIDYYPQADLQVWQIMPDQAHHTLEIPAMTQSFDAAAQPVWQWLVRPWEYPIPRQSMAITNLEVLAGAKATEVTRWEEAEWEIFAGAGPDIPKAAMRIVPLGTLLGIDSSLELAVDLEIGAGLWREPVAFDWHTWD
jgi:hypothetical protein